jgi:hypothetical protein
VSTDPGHALQLAIVPRLKAQVADIASRVYDTVATNIAGEVTATFPYLQIGDDQVLPDDAECVDGSEIYVSVHVWSRAVGWLEAKKIAGQVRDALHLASLTITGHNLIEIRFRDARLLRDPDGKTRHIAMTFRALTEPVD